MVIFLDHIEVHTNVIYKSYNDKKNFKLNFELDIILLVNMKAKRFRTIANKIGILNSKGKKNFKKLKKINIRIHSFRIMKTLMLYYKSNILFYNFSKVHRYNLI